MIAIRTNLWLKGFLCVLAIVLLYKTVSFETNYNKAGKTVSLAISLPHKKFCAPVDTGTLRELAEKKESKFVRDVTYWKRYIQPIPSLDHLPSYSVVNESLLPEHGSLRLQTSSLYDPKLMAPCMPPLKLPITSSPPSGETDLTPLIFGISTSIKRVRENSIQHFQRFLTRPNSTDHRSRVSNGAGIIVHMHNGTDEELEEGQRLFREAGIDALFQHSELEESMPERYLSLIPALLDQSTIDARHGKKRTWLILIDDDTFFPRPDALMKSLNRNFPWADREKLMVGGHREVITDHSPEYTQLQGGAGIFLTIPMVHHMFTERHDIPEKLLGPEHEPNKIPARMIAAKKASYLAMCLEEQKYNGNGDVRISECVRDHTDIKSINLPGLHQMDIFGDLSGFYESGGPFLSTHHWKSWNWHYPNRQSAVGDVCGEDCVFQRWAFTHPLEQTLTDDLDKDEAWPMVLSNGYSISEYEPSTFRKMDLEMAECTFAPFFNPLENMDYGIGNGAKMREKVPEDKKRQWKLLEAKVSEENPAWRTQWYGLLNKEKEIEKIAELVWVSN